MIAGTLLVDVEFTFHDGDEGKKIFVCLGTNAGITVVAKTTSKGTRYGISYGCQSGNRYPCFHLPKNSCFLTKPTWVCLDEFYELNDTVLLQRHFSGKVNRIGVLPETITEQLLECALLCDDITGAQARVVRGARASM
jgi:hypothetical protein